jgi:predicted AAA+ superfamily ATPase
MEELSISSSRIITWNDEKTLGDGIEVIPVWKWLVLNQSETPNNTGKFA